ncbi:hypothetical protein RB195_013513 [Necator americanus]|uniref:Uncharacterized protein n=1 Tax=Necator americanus TaxID=51031 RepID=A0ABR1DVX5_NECAM
MPKAKHEGKQPKERKKKSKKGKKSGKSGTSKKIKKSQKKDKKLQKQSGKSDRKRTKGKDRKKKESVDPKVKHKKSKKDKADRHHKKTKTSSSASKKKPKTDKKNWIEEEFLQPGARDAKPSKPSPQEKMPEGMGAIDSTQQFPPSGIKVEKKVKEGSGEALVVMDSTQRYPPNMIKEEKKIKPMKETAKMVPTADEKAKKPDEVPIALVTSTALPPPPPRLVGKEIEVPSPMAAKKSKERADAERLKMLEEKIYGIKPEKPTPPRATVVKLRPSPPLQGTQDDEMVSSRKAKRIAPEPPRVKASPPKESVTISVTGGPTLSKRLPVVRRESAELAAVGERLRVNIDEILRLGSVMERRGISSTKKMSFEWIAMNRHVVNQQPEAFSSHLVTAVGDVRLEKSLACDALNVLMYQHTVSPDEYLRLSQHLENVQPITIGLLAQLLRTNTQYYNTMPNIRAQAGQIDNYYC